MTLIVVDASAAAAWLLDQPRPAWVDELFAAAARLEARLAVPSLFWLEVGNALVTRRDLSDDQAIDGLIRLEAIGIDTIRTDRPLRLQAILLARETRLTMYDATYLALAIATAATLATLDRELRAAATSRAVPTAGDTDADPRRVSESGAPFARTSDSVSVDAIGAAIGELRRRYADDAGGA